MQKGTTADILMGDYESTKTINVTVVANDKLSNCFTQLTNGEIQAVVVDSGVAESYVAKNPELYKIVYQDMTEGEQFAIAMGLNDTDMQAAINQAMQELEEDGTLKEIYEYWFGAGRRGICGVISLQPQTIRTCRVETSHPTGRGFLCEKGIR